MGDLEIEVLSLVTEDYYGLWEMAVQVPVGRDRLVRVIEGLMGSGLVAWFCRSSDTAEAVHVRRHIPESPELSDDSLWRVPGPVDVQWLLGSTDRGEQTYYGSRHGVGPVA